MSEPVRLQRLLSSAGLASRREAETWITAGRVTVNGVVVTELGSKADPDVDDVRVDGRPVRPPVERTVVALHKPSRVITTKRDPEGRPTVMELLPRELGHLWPIGRLDFDTSGLLLLTDDGDLSDALTHPSHEVWKVYEALVAGDPDERALKRLAEGIDLEEGTTAPARVRRISEGRIEIAIHQGWNRQIRRMTEAVGHPTVRLRRVAVGPIQLQKLGVGAWRRLDAAEIARLRAVAGPPRRERAEKP